MNEKDTVQQSEKVALQPLVERWIEAFNTRNLAVITALYAPDAELFDSGMWRPRYGQSAIESWFRLRFASMPGNVYAPETFTPIDEEHFAVSWTLYGRSPALLGQSWLAHSFQVAGKSHFAVRAGRIYKQHGTYDHLSVLRQILPFLHYAPAPLLHVLYTLYLFRHKQA